MSPLACPNSIDIVVNKLARNDALIFNPTLLIQRSWREGTRKKAATTEMILIAHRRFSVFLLDARRNKRSNSGKDFRRLEHRALMTLIQILIH